MTSLCACVLAHVCMGMQFSLHSVTVSLIFTIAVVFPSKYSAESWCSLTECFEG